MKHFLLCILLLATLSACVESSVSDWSDCNEGMELCIRVTVEEPIVLGKPINLTTIVTSKKDIQDLPISISYVPAEKDTVVKSISVNAEGLQKQNMEIRQLTTWDGGLGGYASVQANKPLTITWQLLTQGWEGFYILNASITTSSGRVTDTIRLYFTEEGGKVYYAGTPIPTDQPIPIITITPGPTPTPFSVP